MISYDFWPDNTRNIDVPARRRAFALLLAVVFYGAHGPMGPMGPQDYLFIINFFFLFFSKFQVAHDREIQKTGF